MWRQKANEQRNININIDTKGCGKLRISATRVYKALSYLCQNDED